MEGLRVVPLGGLGEIGLNMMAVESGGDSVIIDCGLMFPEPHMPGIDIVIPGFDYLRDSSCSIKALLLTHGHEDHIGAVPFLLKEFDVPVYGTSLTLGLLGNKLAEHDLEGIVDCRTVSDGEVVEISENISVRYIPVCHSIPDGSALAIYTSCGTIIHSGDFRFDDAPVDGRKTDVRLLSEEGKKGVKLLLSDSTNVEKSGNTGSEAFLAPMFREQFLSSTGKVFVSLFSSNINRIQQIVDAAEAAGRKIVLVGRSLVSNLRVAVERGYLRVGSETVIDVKAMCDWKPAQIAVITTGSQGEPMSGLSLIAASNHKYISVEDGDKVILSSKSIPGNEKLICRIINQLIRLGAEVLYEKIAPVHVSGHACRDELKYMLELVRPEYFMPVHGELRHLVAHSRLAAECGVNPEKTIVAESGQSVLLTEKGIMHGEVVPAGRLYIDGKGLGDVRDLVIRDRLHMSQSGMVVAVILLDSKDGGIEVFARGVVFEEASEVILAEAKAALNLFLSEASEAIREDRAELEAETGKLLKRFFKKRTGKRPIIVPVVLGG